ncbi:MAG: PBSX family phage terminase large subunit [Oscillospiraceae bacterium]|nr:PBSX family phage terminase large subunit [Oscillospiraceae bacterium]
MLRWWHPQSGQGGYYAVICDGAVRSGKTLCMSLSFVAWAFFAFDGAAFALCGKTIVALKRNILTPLLPLLRELGFVCREQTSKNYVDITFGGRCNRFYCFGGKDEGSAANIQGMTLAGVLLDEVALMPRSFVEQALARCSPEGARLWFNCNPANPQHWFRREWILKREEKNAYYLHFTMDDNPSLSESVKARYRSLYSGAFYTRFVEGEWAAADGLVYPMFAEERHVAAIETLPTRCSKYLVSCDYGTVNPSSFGLWGLQGGIWFRLREYYWDSRQKGRQRTDEEHYRGLEQLVGPAQVECVICDPSAASFMECIRRHGRFFPLPAKNDVLSGIRLVADALQAGKLRISAACTDCIREFGQYVWEEDSGRDAPRKEYDHAMDDMRYFAAHALRDFAAEPASGWFVGAVKR